MCILVYKYQTILKGDLLMKVYVKFLLCFILLLFMSPLNKVIASESEPTLQNANIDIVTEDDVYRIKMHLLINDYKGESIKHYLKTTSENKLLSVSFKLEGQELDFNTSKGEVLDTYNLNASDDFGSSFEYTIEYEVLNNEDEFEVPLFVPDISAASEERNVYLNFEAPKGNVIQKNSFPIVIEKNQEKTSKQMANIPAIVKYVYSEKPTNFHMFNIISFIAISVLILILITWAYIERRKGGEI